MLKGVHQKLDPQETPAFFVRGASAFSRMMFFCALSICMMAMDARLNYLSQVRQAFIGALHPFEVLANAPSEWFTDFKKYLSSHNQLIQENYMLKQTAFEHGVMLQRLSTLQAENTHLRSLLGANIPSSPHAILGEISHTGRDPFSSVVVVNRGSQNNVNAGRAVVDYKGVIGQVTRVYPFSSEVTLITDKNLSIPILIERNQLRAIAFGEGNNKLGIPFLPSNVDIKVGDKLVTSGIDGIYPAGLAVATVTKIEQNPESPFAKIVSTPTAEVNNHLQLLILDLSEPIQAELPPPLDTNSKPNKEKSLIESKIKETKAKDNSEAKSNASR